MDVKQAVAQARSYLSSVFADEDVAEIRLEEVEFDAREDAWMITLSILRPSIVNKNTKIAMAMGTAPLKRSFKVVRIPNDGNGMPSIKIRALVEE